MRVRLLQATGFFLALLLPVAAHAAEAQGGRGLGRQLPVPGARDFTLPDASTGRPVTLSTSAGKRATVLVFTGTECPVSNVYLPRLVQLAGAYRDQGVVFLAINSNAGESAEQAAAHAKNHGLTFPVLKDAGNVVADQLQVERTCEALVLDGQARLCYRGAIDDQYGYGKRKDAPAHSFLRAALDAVLAGRSVAEPSTRVVGCPIDRVEVKAEAPVTAGRVTYAADVAPVLQNKCQSCHRPGQAAPFALLTYDQARHHARSIREVVAERRMPPWHADPHYGHFDNDRSLSPAERATLLAWVDQGAPLGDPRALPAARTFSREWEIGKPDRVFTLPAPYKVAAQGTLPYQRFRVPTGFKEDVWVQAAEARPGERSVVHHIIVYVDDHRKGDKKNLGDAMLCSYAPGDAGRVYPEGMAKRIPAGADLVFEVHYTPVGREKVDRSSVGLVFARKPVTRPVLTVAILNMGFAIPPGADNHPVRSSFTFPRDGQLLSLYPHMHLRGKDFLYKATYPDGRSEVLLSVPAYDFNWQTCYRLASPRAMPKGTRIDCLAHYNNSEGNPANPDPTKTVRWGAQTYDEMMIGFMDVVAGS